MIIKINENQNKRLKEETEAIYQKLWNLFKENKSVNDDLIHKFAESEGISPHEIENKIYEFLSDFINGGKFPRKEVNRENLLKGIDIEKEHINPNSKWADLVAEKISLNHYAESEDSGIDYYTDFLIPGEKQFESKKENITSKNLEVGNIIKKEDDYGK